MSHAPVTLRSSSAIPHSPSLNSGHLASSNDTITTVIHGNTKSPLENGASPTTFSAHRMWADVKPRCTLRQ
ncbi:hypothetical protein RHS04_07173 [Rhizoctonia solani]|uniref:Uncharacterized protein n=1 Tax=Rhizoctonia solani TaxID=456999 RepID=A0A8H7H5G8_9AGAM|nr:hypothetical protein RHS04_07173 [Rhizoctonia solani]